MRNCWIVTNRWQTVANLVTLPALPLAIYLVVSGESPYWLLLSFVVYFLMHGAMVVGCHMLLTHRTFTTSPLWEKGLAVLSTLAVQGSPASWVHAHLLHHVYSDTERDPHITTWRFFFTKNFRSGTGKPVKIVIQMMRQPFYRWLHIYGGGLCLGVALLLLVISPKLLLFAYAVPVSYTFLAVACSLVLLHRGGRPRNCWLFIPFFPAGEWFHKDHHEYPADWRRSGWSLVYYLIPLIEKR